MIESFTERKGILISLKFFIVLPPLRAYMILPSISGLMILIFLKLFFPLFLQPFFRNILVTSPQDGRAKHNISLTISMENNGPIICRNLALFSFYIKFNGGIILEIKEQNGKIYESPKNFC